MKRDHQHNHSHPPLSLRASVKNWRDSDLPFFQKLKVAARNEATKLRTRQHCCGHPGEPGC